MPFLCYRYMKEINGSTSRRRRGERVGMASGLFEDHLSYRSKSIMH